MFLYAIFLIGLVTIGYLVSTVRTQLRDLETATSDNIQWNLSQLEVEFLAFIAAVDSAQLQPDDDLKDVRRRFDILYSRISSFRSGALFGVFRDDAETNASLQSLRGFLDQVVEDIDGPDDALRDALPMINALAQESRQHARTIALEGIQYFSKQRDMQRKVVYETLLTIAILTILLLMVLTVMVVFLNVLNRQNNTRAMQNAMHKSRMSAIVTTSLDAIVAVNRHGIILDFNGAAEEIFGYTEAEAIGQPMADLIIPDHLRAAHAAGMERYLKTGVKRVVGTGRIRLEARRKNGDLFPVEFSIAEAKGQDGEIFISYLRDISKEVEAEEELKEARDAAIAGEKSKSRFLAVMSHEMRTPLNGLLGTMELLGDTELTPQQQRFLQIMEKSGGQLLSHVNDVLDISRLEAGKSDFNKTIFDIHAVIEDIIQSQNAAARAHSNVLSFSPEHDGQMLVDTDRVRLRQVVLNLVGNAIKFTRNGIINIEIETLPDGRTLELRVMDTGIGIPEDKLNAIFEDFSTLDSTYGRKAEGTGLGLGIARRVTEALGGQIGVESELGEGSLFWIKLPVVVPDDHVQPINQQSTEDKVGTPGQVQPLNILLVEDNLINREIARSFLEGDHHVVTEAHDGKEGVALANQKAFDLILMDISMPEMDGIEATRAIRSGNGPSSDVPILALTAHTQQSDVESFLAAGMNDTLFKPMTRQTMRTALAALGGPGDSNTSTAAGNGHSLQNLIDTETLTGFRSDIGAENFSTFLTKFIDQTEIELTELHNRSGEISADEMAKTAHRLFGSAAIFGAIALRKSLKTIELEAKAHPDADFQNLVDDAAEIWAGTRQELLAYKDK